MIRWAKLRGFSPMKFCAEVLLRCLVHQCLFTENSRGTLKNREYCESFAQRIFPRQLQYSIKSKQTRCIKNSNLRKEVGIAIKSKETSSQFESVRNSYVAIMHQPVTFAQPCSKMHVQIKAFSSTSTRFNPYFGWCYHLYILYRPK